MKGVHHSLTIIVPDTEIVSQSKQVRIETKRIGATLWVATSPDVPGLHVAEESELALREELPKVLKALYEAKGIAADVSAPDGELEISSLDVFVH